MQSAIANLYATFASYRLGSEFVGCDRCVSVEHSAQLASKPLRELTYEDLERYSRKALTTWGNVRHFKYFLPRLLELTIEHRDEFLDLAVVFGKLSYADWYEWPGREREAVSEFLNEYWSYQLDQPIASAYDDAIDTVLCALANACQSVHPFLDTWVQTKTSNAKRHLAAFILINSEDILSKSRLSNTFWNRSGKPYHEVLAWLPTDEVLAFLNGHNALELDGEFSYAQSQLVAIRAAFGEGRV